MLLFFFFHFFLISLSIWLLNVDYYRGGCMCSMCFFVNQGHWITIHIYITKQQYSQWASTWRFCSVVRTMDWEPLCLRFHPKSLVGGVQFWGFYLSPWLQIKPDAHMHWISTIRMHSTSWDIVILIQAAFPKSL